MLRRCQKRNFHFGIIGQAHPDVQYGFMQRTYRGPGWMHVHKLLPQQCFLQPGGQSFTNHYDRQGPMPDPEDPRHPITRLQLGETKGHDGCVSSLVHAEFGPIPLNTRFMAVLYDNFLEPFSMHRIACQLNYFGKVPNWSDQELYAACEYIGETTALIGNCICSNGTTIMEGVTANASVNDIYILEGTQIFENVCMIADQPTTLHHYQRDEQSNPYQTMEMMEGVVRIGPNCMIEPNVLLESCQIGACCKIGHNTKVMKGVNMGILCHVLPGSVVVADTNIPDGEVWGGAPAVKIGKVSKFEWKRPYYPSQVHRETIVHVFADQSHYGDQVVEYQRYMDSLTTLLVEYDNEVPDGVRAKIKDQIEGKEPFHHMVARITQGWVPTNRADDKCGDHLVPCIASNYHARHNDDSTGGRYAGTPLSGMGLAWVKNQR